MSIIQHLSAILSITQMKSEKNWSRTLSTRASSEEAACLWPTFYNYINMDMIAHLYQGILMYIGDNNKKDWQRLKLYPIQLNHNLNIIFQWNVFENAVCQNAHVCSGLNGLNITFCYELHTCQSLTTHAPVLYLLSSIWLLKRWCSNDLTKDQ